MSGGRIAQPRAARSDIRPGDHQNKAGGYATLPELAGGAVPGR
jgi:hypothetical protein